MGRAGGWPPVQGRAMVQSLPVEGAQSRAMREMDGRFRTPPPDAAPRASTPGAADALRCLRQNAGLGHTSTFPVHARWWPSCAFLPTPVGATRY